MTLGKFFIRSSGEVNGIASPLLPKGFPAPPDDLGSLGSVNAINRYWLPSCEASILEAIKLFSFLAA